MELISQNGDFLYDFKGENLYVVPIVSNKNMTKYGLFLEEDLIGAFDSLNAAIAEAQFIFDIYLDPYRVGESDDFIIADEFDEDDFEEYFNGEENED
jgi:hypothetical protein